MKREDWIPYARAMGIVSMIAVELVAFGAAGVALGYLAIHKLGAPEWTLFVTSTLGLAAATYRIFLSTSKLAKSEEEGDRE